MSSDSDLEDEQLQQALALSLHEYAASPAGQTAAGAAGAGQQREQGPGQGAAAQKAAQQQVAAEAPKQRAARVPMRGKRKQPDQTDVKQEPGSPPPQHQRQEQQQEQPQHQPLQQQSPPQQQQQPAPQQGSAAAAAAPGKQPAGGAAKGAGKPAARPRQPRKKKLPLWSPSESEVEAMFELLTGGGGALLTVERLTEAAADSGLELTIPGAKNMMRYAAEGVLGWGSGAGRAQAALSLAAFRGIVDHFRVTAA